MRFMWLSNAPWAGTGYGAQTKLLLKALKDRGHDPHAFAFYGLSGGKINYDGYEVWPNSDYEAWGNDVIGAHVERSKVELLVSLVDLFVLDAEVYETLGVPWFAWTPIDSTDIGSHIINRLLICNPVAMSWFGAKQMERYDISPADVIYHAVDTDVFKPLDKAECRAEFNIDADFLIGMVMANKGDRKQYPRQLEAVAQFMGENKDLKVKLYLHTETTSRMGGWDMVELCRKLGLKGKVYSTNPYDATIVPLSAEKLARIYNCFDVLMNCSSGEGFGIPIVEAQACGVPVIATNETAMVELVHNGYLVESAARALGSHYGYQYQPDVEEMVWRLNSVYRMSLAENNQMGIQWVKEHCGLDVIADQWHELFSQVELMLERRIKQARKVAS